MIEDFLIPLAAVGLAELGDKTQLSVLLLSTKTEKHLQLFFGVMAGFFLVDGFAILLGSWITNLIPEETLKLAAGIVFILFGLLILKNTKDEKEDNVKVKNPFITGFTLIAITEMGDKTQLASALFATQYDLFWVLLGVMSALASLSIAAIYLGRFLSEKMDKKMISKAAGILFITLGMSFFFF